MDVTSTAQPSTTSPAGALISMFYEPTKTFRELAPRPRGWFPTIVLMLSISANTVKAANAVDKAKIEMSAEQRVQFERITNRVEEIKHMDKSQLSRAEKKELRNELKAMKNQARALGGGGVYLSVGAIIIIILLLILIL